MPFPDFFMSIFCWQWGNISRWRWFTPAGEKLTFRGWKWQSRDGSTRQPDLGPWGLRPHWQNPSTRHVRNISSLSLRFTSQDIPTRNESVRVLGHPAATFPYEECRYTTGPSTWRTARFGSTSRWKDGTPALSVSGSTTLGRAAPTTTWLASPSTMCLWVSLCATRTESGTLEGSVV